MHRGHVGFNKRVSPSIPQGLQVSFIQACLSGRFAKYPSGAVHALRPDVGDEPNTLYFLKWAVRWAHASTTLARCPYASWPRWFQ